VKYQAVIFDLGGTLSRSAAWEEYRDAARKIAEICTAPVDKFVELWFANSAGLGVSKFKTWSDYIKYLCGLMSIDVPAENHLKDIADIQYALTKGQICVPHPGAVELLDYLKSNAYKLGLISDCFYDVPKAWPETPFAPYFEVTVFSCEVRMNKANPKIFKIALDKLGVNAKDCVYIADGMRNELANATGLGMKAIQLFIPEENDDSPIRENWQGTKISSLHEVYNLLQ
jgi:putative hydrolase of the HAD superfamily